MVYVTNNNEYILLLNEHFDKIRLFNPFATGNEVLCHIHTKIFPILSHTVHH